MNKDMTILLVDDFSTIRQIIKGLLGELGFSNIIEAEDGEAALSIVQKGGVDLVITDWSMPKMSGIELVRSVRDDDSFRGLPVMMVTAEATREQIIAAAEAGVDSYVVKPFSADALKERIASLVGESESAPE